jgi:hypothetical protein
MSTELSTISMHAIPESPATLTDPNDTGSPDPEMAEHSSSLVSERYVRERLHEAVDILVAGATPIRERVEKALIALTLLERDDFVDGWNRQEFVSLMTRANAPEASKDEGAIAATLDVLSTEEIQDIARNIAEIHDYELRRQSAG